MSPGSRQDTRKDLYTRNMYDEIKEFVKICHLCQRMNPKFVKINAKLHPVPVHAQVWHKVSCIAVLLWAEL